MSPPGVRTVRQPAAGVQLRVAGELLGRPQPGVGDPGLVERLADLVGGAVARRTSSMMAVSSSLWATRSVLAREARVGRQVGLPQDVTAEDEPLPFVLDPEEDGAVGAP